MNKKEENKILKDLKEKLDAFMKEGIELSNGLDVAERNRMIKKVLDKNFNTAVKNIKKSGEALDKNKEKEIKEFIEDYYEQKIREM